MIYLASPYSHSDPKVREDRYLGAARALNFLLQDRRWAFSPIVHCHPVAVRYGLPTDHEFWLEYDGEFLKRCDELVLLTLPGWTQSKGMLYERKFMEARKVPIFLMSMTPDRVDEPASYIFGEYTRD